MEIRRDELVPDEGSGGHVMLSIQDLMAQPILRKKNVIPTGELTGEIEVAKSHGAPPYRNKHNTAPSSTSYPVLPLNPRASRPNARSWPQAALTSSPRRRRTVAIQPRCRRRSLKASTRASSG